MKKNVNIVTEYDGNKVIIISDIRFKGKTREEWEEVEEYLKEYIGTCYEIAETADKIYIGELIQIETNKSKTEDYNSKHKKKAKYGWYRYDTRLGLPVYNLQGEIERYNIFKLRMLVRHDADGKLYLYDFLRTKKEMSSPL